MEGIPNDPGWPGADPAPDASATALAVRTASRDVYPGWTVPQGDSDPGSAADRAIEAQVAAAVEGRKPRYFEPWGNPGVADRLASAYRKVIPPQVAVESREGMVFVSSPDEKLAARIASERADDFIRAFGWPDVRFEMARVD